MIGFLVMLLVAILSRSSVESIRYPSSYIPYFDMENPDIAHICNGYVDFYTEVLGLPDGCKQVHYSRFGTLISYAARNPFYTTDCYWIICLNPGNILRLVFDRLAIDSDPRCNYNLRLYESLLPQPPRLNSTKLNEEYIQRTLYWDFCGNENPSVIAFKSHVAIRLRTTNQWHSAFSAKFWILKDDKETIGLIRMSGDRGVISTPKYPSPYISRVPCTWEISAPRGRQIQLNLSDVSLVGGCCETNFLEIRNGPHATSPSLGYFCEHTIHTDLLVSDSNSMWIRYYTAIQQRGFKLQWNALKHGCGNTFKQPTGIIMSPGYPNAPDPNLHCTWYITVNEGSTIRIDFLDIDLKVLIPGWKEPCYLQYIEIFQGHPEEGNSKGRFCLDSHFNPVVLTSNKASIRLVTSWICEYYRGFQLRYVSEAHQVLKSVDGTFESLNYPNGYAENLNFTWTIQATYGNTIVLDFIDLDLDREDRSGTVACGDYVKVTVWDSKAIIGNKADLGTYCGTISNSSIFTETDMASITMVTDNTRSNEPGRGFKLKWSQKGCGGNIKLGHTETKYIASPRFPEKYTNSIECHWRITTLAGVNVKVVVEQVEIEWEENCKFDSLRILDGDNLHAPELMNICGRKTTGIELTSRGSAMYIGFKSDDTISYKGFTAYLEPAVIKGCRYEYKGQSGHIYSPNWPLNYNNYENCVWTIIANPYHLFRFDMIKLQFGFCENDCPRCDYNQTFDGYNVKFPVCNVHWRRSLQVFRPYKQDATVHFYSDKNKTVSGFDIYYEMVCGGVITDEVGYIVSPSLIPGTGEVVNCSWHIKARTSENILLVFTEIEWTIGKYSCNDNFVKVVDSDKNTIYNKCCGPVPPPILTTGNHLNLEVLGDHQFRALFVKVPTRCLEGIPPFSDYSNTTACGWNIPDVDGQIISLQLKTSQPQVNISRCRTGFVEVYALDILQGIYCGDVIPTRRVDTTEQFWTVYVD